MAEVIYQSIDAIRPDLDDDQCWIYVEETHDGLFFGSGGSWKASGEWVGYCSLREDDLDLDRAVAAAQKWAARYDVPMIWVFAGKQR